jgi:hypothetical protein
MADGMAESLIKRAKEKLARLELKKGGDWDLNLHTVLQALRSEPGGPLTISPFRRRFGREMKLPSFYNRPTNELTSVTEVEMKELWQAIADARDGRADEMKERYDQGRVEAEFKAGDQVWLRNHDMKSKMDAKWIGPFRIKERSGDRNLNFVLERDPAGPSLARKHANVNVKHLKPYDVHETPKAEEWEVKSIKKHRKDRGVFKYNVEWDDGSFTWEPARMLIDDNGEEVKVNKALLAYWERKPWIQEEEGGEEEEEHLAVL